MVTRTSDVLRRDVRVLLDSAGGDRSGDPDRLGRRRIPRSRQANHRVVPVSAWCILAGRHQGILALHQLLRRASSGFCVAHRVQSVAGLSVRRSAHRRATGADHIVQLRVRGSRRVAEGGLRHGGRSRDTPHARDVSKNLFRSAFRHAGRTADGVVAAAVGGSIVHFRQRERCRSAGPRPGTDDGDEIHGMAGVGPDGAVAACATQYGRRPPAPGRPSRRARGLLHRQSAFVARSGRWVPGALPPEPGPCKHAQYLDRVHGRDLQRAESPALVQHTGVAGHRHAADDVRTRRCRAGALSSQTNAWFRSR